MKPAVAEVVRVLLAASEDSREVTIDQVGEAVGIHAVSTDDIDDILAELERRGRRLIAPEGGGGEDRLRAVVTTARALVAELGRKPTVSEIAARAGLSADEVRQALALAQVIQR